MDIEQLKEQRTFMSLSPSKFKNPELAAAFGELLDFMNYYLGSLWLTALVENEDISNLPGRVPFSMGITSASDPLMQYGVGITRDDLKTKYVPAARMASPAALSGILSIIEMLTRSYLPDEVIDPIRKTAKLLLKEETLGRPVNSQDYASIYFSHLFSDKPDIEIITQALKSLGFHKDKRNRYMHRTQGDDFAISPDDVSSAWFHSVKILISLDQWVQH